MRISCLTRNEERQNERGIKYSKEETASQLLTTVSHLRWARCPLINHPKFHFTLNAASKQNAKGSRHTKFLCFTTECDSAFPPPVRLCERARTKFFQSEREDSSAARQTRECFLMQTGHLGEGENRRDRTFLRSVHRRHMLSVLSSPGHATHVS